MRNFLLPLLVLSGLRAAPPAAKPDPAAEFYAIARAPNPPGIDPQIGGLDTTPSGEVAACFHRGEVAFFNPKTQAWRVFAEGLHEPLGLLVEPDGSLLVMQRAELTRLRDLDGDGKADLYQTVWDGFGMTGNYHEFAFGPARGPDGRVYVSLNVASNGDTIREEIRGPWSDVGVPRALFYTEFRKNAGAIGRMYARVAYRGWVVAVDPATGAAEPLASGFRSPDGIGFDAAGRLLVSDNQGDWRGTSELFVVKPGGFYGHPASLVWRPDWDGREPLKVPVEELNRLRTPAAVWFPHSSFANSPTQPVVIPKSAAWGPFGGQTIIGEMNNARILRLLLEEVAGVSQGATVALVQSPALKNGLHRFAFAGDTLWIGRTHLSWAGGEGMSSLVPTGKVPFDVADMRITADGFALTFTEPLSAAAAQADAWPVQRYGYHYHAAYGSPQVGLVKLAPSSVTLSGDGRTARVAFAEMKADQVMEFDLTSLVSASGRTVLNPRVAYTVRKIPSK